MKALAMAVALCGNFCLGHPAVSASPPASSQPAQKKWRSQILAFAQAARREMGTVGDPEKRDSLLCDISSAQAAGGDVAAAQDTAAEISGGSSLILALGSIAEAQAHFGDVPAAFRTLALIEDQDNKDPVLRTVAIEQAKAGDVPAARRTAEGIRDRTFRNYALQGIADAQAQGGDMRAAFQTLRQVKTEPASPPAPTVVAMNQARAGDFAGALRTADTLGDGKDYSLQQIAFVQAETGDTPGALRSVALIQDEDLKSSVFDDIAREQAEAAARKGDLHAAQAAANGIKGNATKTFASGYIAAAQVRGGDAAGAEKTIASLPSGWSRAEGYVTLAECLAEDKD